MGTKSKQPAPTAEPEVQTSALALTTAGSAEPVVAIPPPPGGGSWRWDGALWQPNITPQAKDLPRVAGADKDPTAEPEVTEASVTT